MNRVFLVLAYQECEDGAEQHEHHRLHETDQREIIPCAQWTLDRLPIADAKGGVAGTLPQVRLELLEGRFEPGYLYELVCEAEGSIWLSCSISLTRTSSRSSRLWSRISTLSAAPAAPGRNDVSGCPNLRSSIC